MKGGQVGDERREEGVGWDEWREVARHQVAETARQRHRGWKECGYVKGNKESSLGDILTMCEGK